MDDDIDYPYETESHGIAIAVAPLFLPEESNPANRQFVWAYQVRIANGSPRPVQLLTRHWIITDANGQVQEVKGDGVVGEQPMLAPGEAFVYASGCPLNTPSGFMGGSYGFVDDAGRAFNAAIPTFSLDSPYAVRSVN
jgi:ApaG protein